MTIAIILPALNEEKTITSTIKAFHKALPKAHIWIVNNDSSDRTYELATKVLKDENISGGVLNEPVKGKGNAMRRAFLEINADIYLVADADETYSALDAHKLIEPIEENRADIVVGNRQADGVYKAINSRQFHNFGNKLVCFLVNYLFSSNLSDIMSGYRAFNKKFVKNYPILVSGFEIETDMTLFALDKRFRMLEVPIRYLNRPLGSFSKLNTFRDGAKVIFTIIRIFKQFKPLVFFGSFAFLFFVMGLITAIPVITDWVLYKYIYHLPLAVLATGIEILALTLLAIALLLDSISTQNKRNFEHQCLRQSLQKNTNL